ncbi:MAG: DUF4166 domain-containing protein [Candidatus Thiodiazotropha sp. (ex Semelilucina semeliformis)]|nr:DUF4166 domain-containing protein [Candidatus Thiodiazotropha sp. (ex Semelilucina semeliformis)]
MQKNKALSVMQKALGEQWDQLDEIVQRHYEMKPGQTSRITVSGTMDRVFHSNIAKLFLLPGRLFGALIPYRGINIATEVRNWTEVDNEKAMFWHRTLKFPGKPLAVFKSRMEHVAGDEIIEYVRFGMGIRMRMSVSNGALVFTSRGYTWDIGIARLSIPTWAILGDAEIIERAISEKEFYMDFNMVHPLFGQTFGYSGTFSIDPSAME